MGKLSPRRGTTFPLPTRVFLFALIVLAGVIWYLMTPMERDRAVRAVVRFLPRIQAVAALFRTERDELLDKMLRERTPWPVVTPVIAGINVAIYTWIGMDAHVPVVDLLGNFGPTTTNGEWWRLVTAAFVHTSLIHLVLNTAAVVHVGLVLERLVGSLTFAAVYLSASMLSSVVALSAAPVETLTGASGAIFGVYGFLIALWMWGTFQHAETTVRLRTIRRLAPFATIYTVFALSSDHLATTAECMGLVAGFGCGILTARPVRLRKPPIRRIATTLAASAYFTVSAVVPLWGISDVRPVLASIEAIEGRTAAAYNAEVDKFRKGRIDRFELADVIERRIIPELHRGRVALHGLNRTPHEHLSRVQAAEIYGLRRIEGWKVRAAALRAADSKKLRDADAIERAALDRFARVR
jgi:membrane associated rhomboid family serine protease